MDTTVREGKIYSTTDYTKFKRLLGNRDVKEARVAMIKKMIEMVGYISNPIIVNEKYEIIDGQGRVEALKQLEKPVEYRVIRGTGLNECRAMNLKPTAWSITDYVKSYAETGLQPYIWLMELHEKYRYSFSLLCALKNHRVICGGTVGNNVKEGTLSMTDSEHTVLEDVCEELYKYIDICMQIGGRQELIRSSIGYILQLPGVDKNRLWNSISQRTGMIKPAIVADTTLKELSDAYNTNYSKQNRMYFDYEYKKTV